MSEDDGAASNEPPRQTMQWVVFYPGGVNVRRAPMASADLTGEFLEAGRVFEGTLELTDDGDDCYTQLTDKRGWVPAQKGTISVLKVYDAEAAALAEEEKNRSPGRRGSSAGNVSSPTGKQRKGSVMDQLRRLSTGVVGNDARRGSSATSPSRRDSGAAPIARRGSSLGNIANRRGSSMGQLTRRGSSNSQSVKGGGYIDLAASAMSNSGGAVVSAADLESIANQLREQMLELNAKQDAEARLRLQQLEREEERLRLAREKEREAELAHLESRRALVAKTLEESQREQQSKLAESEQAMRSAVDELQQRLREAADLAELRVQGAAEARLRTATTVLQREMKEAWDREDFALERLRETREREEAERCIRIELEERVRVEAERKSGSLVAHAFAGLPLGLGFYDSSSPKSFPQVSAIEPRSAASLVDIREGDTVVGILEKPLLGRGFGRELRAALSDPATYPATLLFRRDAKSARKLALLMHLEQRASERRRERELEDESALARALELARIEKEALEAARERFQLAAAERARTRGDKVRRAEERQQMAAEDCLNFAVAPTAERERWRVARESRLMFGDDPQEHARPVRRRAAERVDMAAEDARSEDHRAYTAQRRRRRRQRDADRRLALAEERVRHPQRFKLRGLEGGGGFRGHAFAMLASQALGQLAERLLQQGLFSEAKAVLARAVDVVDANSPSPLPSADLAVVFTAPPLGLEFQRGVAAAGASKVADVLPPLVARVHPGGTAALHGVVAGCEVVAVEGSGTGTGTGTGSGEAGAVKVRGYDHLMRLLLGCAYPVTVVFRPPDQERVVVFDAPPLGMALLELGGSPQPRVQSVAPAGTAERAGVCEGWELLAVGAAGSKPQPVFSFDPALAVLQRAAFPLTLVFRGPSDDTDPGAGAGAGAGGRKGELSVWGSGWMADLYDEDDDDINPRGPWDEQQTLAAMAPVWAAWDSEAKADAAAAAAATAAAAEGEGGEVGGRPSASFDLPPSSPAGSAPASPSKGSGAAEQLQQRALAARLFSGESVSPGRTPALVLLGLALDGWAAVCASKEHWAAQADALTRRLALLDGVDGGCGDEGGQGSGEGQVEGEGGESQLASVEDQEERARLVLERAQAQALAEERARILALAQAKADAEAKAKAQALELASKKKLARVRARAYTQARAEAEVQSAALPSPSSSLEAQPGPEPEQEQEPEAVQEPELEPAPASTETEPCVMLDPAADVEAATAPEAADSEVPEPQLVPEGEAADSTLSPSPSPSPAANAEAAGAADEQSVAAAEEPTAAEDVADTLAEAQAQTIALIEREEQRVRDEALARALAAEEAQAQAAAAEQARAEAEAEAKVKLDRKKARAQARALARASAPLALVTEPETESTESAAAAAAVAPASMGSDSPRRGRRADRGASPKPASPAVSVTSRDESPPIQLQQQQPVRPGAPAPSASAQSPKKARARPAASPRRVLTD